MHSITDTVIACAAALAAGLALAATGLLQQYAARERPSRERGSLKLILHLLRSKVWLAGSAAALISYGFQAVALSFGPLALVQPIILSEVVFAVPISVRLRGVRLGTREWTAVVGVVAGLALAIGAAYPRGGDPTQPITEWAWVLGAVTILAAASILASRLIRGTVKASLLAFAGALVLGMQSALYAATIAHVRTSFITALTDWTAYALIVASFLGMYLVQNAYQAGTLAASMPVMDATIPLTAILIGILLFNESIRTAPLALAGAVLGLIIAGASIIMLDLSPVVRKEQRVESQAQS